VPLPLEYVLYCFCQSGFASVKAGSVVCGISCVELVLTTKGADVTEAIFLVQSEGQFIEMPRAAAGRQS
jgi:hypothetical protein